MTAGGERRAFSVAVYARRARGGGSADGADRTDGGAGGGAGERGRHDRGRSAAGEVGESGRDERGRSGAGEAGPAGARSNRGSGEPGSAAGAAGGLRVLVIEHRRLGTWLPIGGELEPGETPLEAASRELREETGLVGRFRTLDGALDGVPPGLLGYEEHRAGSKGVHLNFVFVAEVDDDAEVTPNQEFGAWRWVDRAELDRLASPLNVRQFGVLALDARLIG